MLKNELKAAMARFGDRQEDLAAYLGMATSTLSYKINGENEFRRDEIALISQRYGFTADELQRIFFADMVNRKETEDNTEVTT